MANANCLTITDPAEFKLCPFRIHQVTHKPAFVGHGDIVTQEFYPCMGEKCIAYHVGICLRLSDAVENLYKKKV